MSEETEQEAKGQASDAEDLGCYAWPPGSATEDSTAGVGMRLT